MTSASTDTRRAEVNLRLLWSGQLVSQVGSEVTKLALPLYALSALHATSGQLGLLRAAAFAPVMVAMPLIGVWTDRLRRRPVLIAVNTAQAVVLALLAAAAFNGDAVLVVLVAGVAVLGVLAQFAEVGYPALVPAVVGEGDLARANGRLFGAQSIAETAGPGIAGLLLGWVGLGWVLVLDALSFLVATATLLRIRVVETVRDRAERHLLREITVGLRAVVAHPVLRATIATATTYNLVDSAATTVFLVHAANGLGMSVTQIGMVLGCGSVGAILGSFASSRIAAALGIGRAMTLMQAAGTILPFALVLPDDAGLGSVALCTAVFVVWCFAIAAYSVQSLSIRQSVTPEHLLGRVMAGSWVFVLGAVPIGALLGGAAGNAWGPGTALVVCLLALPISLVVLATSPVPRITALPKPDPAFWERHG
ncbi:MFS transporter [Actinophytocola sp. NPDC049390]|uniref:MFS transporter n=1 Tax=Actinophytocola sp. NPDC049390 TaxID=3363894 RepID=UPI003796A526